jgi:hypothetical protein
LSSASRRPSFQSEKSLSSLRPRRRFASAVRLMVMLTRGVCRAIPRFFCDRFGRGDDAARDETWPAFVLARQDEDRIAFRDVFATIHCLLRAERESLRLRIANLGFDREHHTLHLAPLISMAVHGARPNE